MLDRLRPRLTYANVMATIAVFVALGGSGYAGVRINGRDIKNGSIGGKKLGNRTITGRKIKRDTVTGANVKEATLGRVPSAANAAALGGSSLAQVRAGIDAAAFGGTPRSGFYSSADVDARLPVTAEKRSTGEQGFTAASPIDRMSVTLTAPRAGFALVVASGEIHPNALVPASHQCTAEMSVSQIPQVGRSVTFDAGDTSFDYRSVANSWIVPVTAGSSTFTLHLAVSTGVSTSCTDTLDSASSSLNAVWLP